MAGPGDSRAQVLSADAARALLRQKESGGGPASVSLPVFPRQLGAPPGAGDKPIDIHEPGGRLLANMLHPSFGVFERENRVLPDDSWYDLGVSPTRPVQFEVLGYKIPDQMHFWIFDYEFSVFRLSGIDPSDIVEAEPGRFSSVMGFDITVNGKRPANLQFQLDPQPVSLTKQSMNTQGTPSGPTPTTDQFNASAFNSFASTAYAGQSLLPVRRAVQGPEGQPWTIIAKQGETVSLACVIFRRVRAPIGAVKGRVAGYLLNANLSETLLERMRPR